MRIAFDLDDTLLATTHDFPIEFPIKKFWSMWFKYEPLRKGTSKLFSKCRLLNCEIWIYTTSFRSPIYIKKIFWLYGIQIDGVVNQDIHNQHVKQHISKYPPAFEIDILIDNSEGVKIEGERYDFKTIWVLPDDDEWVENILLKLKQNI